MSAAGSLIGPKNDELAESVYKTASFHLFGSYFFVLKMKQTLVLVKQEGNIWLETPVMCHPCRLRNRSQS